MKGNLIDGEFTAIAKTDSYGQPSADSLHWGVVDREPVEFACLACGVFIQERYVRWSGGRKGCVHCIKVKRKRAI